MSQRETVPVDDLEPHPYNQEILPDDDPTERFVGDISKNGIEERLKIDSEDRILDGKRRWRAAKLLDMDTIQCERREYEDEEQEKAAILALNDHRDETFTQKIKMALHYEELVAPLYEERMKTGKQLDEVYDLQEETEKGGAGGQHVLSILTRGANLTGKTEKYNTRRAYAADRVGWSPTKLYQAKQIWFAKEGDLDIEDDDKLQRLQEIAEKQVVNLDQGEQSVYGAYQEIELWKKRVASGHPVTWDELREADAHFNVFAVEDEYEVVREEIEAEASWESAIETTMNHWEDSGAEADLQAELTFAYLLEADDDVSISDDGPTPQLDKRKPDGETLHELYWEQEMEMSQVRVRFGVPTLLVVYWMVEEDVPVRFGELTDQIQEKLAMRSIVPESYGEGGITTPEESDYTETAADGGESPSDSD